MDELRRALVGALIDAEQDDMIGPLYTPDNLAQYLAEHEAVIAEAKSQDNEWANLVGKVTLERDQALVVLSRITNLLSFHLERIGYRDEETDDALRQAKDLTRD